MRKRVFQLGDTVYHPQHGEVKITHVFTDNRKYPYGISLGVNLGEAELSFTPWPVANHERPVQDGWWLVKCGGAAVTLREKRTKDVYDSDGQRVGTFQAYEFIRYLGKDWKK